MATTSTHINASPAEVFAVLSDGWSYTNWVVGTSHMRAVEASWPQVGSKLHHAVGAWPLMRRDETVVEEVETDRRIALTAKGRPFGEALVVLELEPSGDGCEVTMHETPSAGPGRWLPEHVIDTMLVPRNNEALARLSALVERRTEPSE